MLFRFGALFTDLTVSEDVARPLREHSGLSEHTISMHMEGTGGQSFDALLAADITQYLFGHATDQTGKRLSGGRIAVRPSID